MKTLSTVKEFPINKNDHFTQSLGMIITIGSLAMLFITLLVSYGILRVRANIWNSQTIDTLPLILIFINTGVILFSSYTYFKGNKSAVIHNRLTTQKWVNATIILGFIFLIFQIVIWFILTSNGFIMTSSQISAVFYLLSGLHGIHIIAGLILLIWLNIKIQLMENNHLHLKLVGMFWHFLTIVWIVIFSTVIII
jgi:heme/copper-type cytochrome/quinol oxidase subunit 3